MPLEKCGVTLAAEIARVDPAPVILGYSMGGRLALHALLAEPNIWQGAIIISAHPGLSDEAARRERREKDAAWSALALKAEWSDFLAQWQDQTVLAGVEMPDRFTLKDRRASIARSFIDWSLGAQENLIPQLSEITTPVLWITGEQDHKFTSLAEQAVPNLPHGKHITLKECGHRVPWEKPDEFTQLVRAFLETT